MSGWFHKIKESSRETKIFAIMGLIFGLTLILTAIFAYVRLDFVRSYEQHQESK